MTRSICWVAIQESVLALYYRQLNHKNYYNLLQDCCWEEESSIILGLTAKKF